MPKEEVEEIIRRIPHGTPAEEKAKIFKEWDKEGLVRSKINVVVAYNGYNEYILVKKAKKRSKK